jgi:DNA-binding FadR family transcriptional regulator
MPLLGGSIIAAMPPDMLDERNPGEGAPLVEHLLSRIEADLTDKTFRPGEFMGTRRDLCARYDVTADIFFQAARVLEARGLVEVRPGSGGGLFVTGDSMAGCARRLGTYLEFVGVDFEDTGPVSRLLQGMCVRGGAAHVTIEKADAITAKVRALTLSTEHFDRSRLLGGLFETFADAGGNPVLSLFFRVVTSVMLDLTAIDEPDWANHAPQAVIVDIGKKIAAAVIGHDEDAAASHYLMLRHSLDLRHDIRDRGNDVVLDVEIPFDASRGNAGTLSARLARHILKEVRHRRWPVGQKLGTEPELLAKYGVSRTTFRQAIRLLEEYSAVETRRGPRGGLLIASPNPSSLNQTAIALLAAHGATAAQTRALLSPLVLLSADALAATATDPGQAADGLISAIVAGCGNRTVHLLVKLATGYLLHLGDRGAGMTADTTGRIATFAEAVRARDQARARCALGDLVGDVASSA